jgi:hypothetical protein
VAVLTLEIAFLVVGWLTALVTLVIFLESWFALTRKSRLGAISCSTEAGGVTVLVAVRGDIDGLRRTIASVLDQSYPLLELVLVCPEHDRVRAALVREFSGRPSRVRAVRVPFGLDSETDRIRAFDQIQNAFQGSWVLVLDSDAVLESHAVESALAFVRDREITALGLAPGVECSSLVQRLVAPSLEWFVRMMGVIDRGRETAGRSQHSAGFMLFHADTQSILSRMNRMPGILNESGWTLWSYRLEGFRTFLGDGSGWVFREATPRSLLSQVPSGSAAHAGRRAAAFLAGSAAVALVSVPGMAFGLASGGESLVSHGILYLSAFSYSLMATSYFFYSRRLRAATWFAPLWFVTHLWALLLIVLELGRSRPPASDLSALPEGSELSARK